MCGRSEITYRTTPRFARASRAFATKPSHGLHARDSPAFHGMLGSLMTTSVLMQVWVRVRRAVVDLQPPQHLRALAGRYAGMSHVDPSHR